MAKLLLTVVLLGCLALSQAFPRRLKLVPHRIVGGEPAAPGELPYSIILRYYGSFICGGSILSSNLIITAGHCAEIGSAGAFSIVAGDHNRNVNEGTEQERQVSSVIIHRDYDTDWLYNDIALMTLSSPLDLNDRVGPIPLAPAGHAATGNVVVSGWGATSESGSTAAILQKVTVPIISDDECRGAYGDEDVLDSMICAGVPEGGRDSCQGDSGGPMVANDIGMNYLAGLVSWGYGCARPGFPGVYTEVSAFRDWIDEQVL